MVEHKRCSICSSNLNYFSTEIVCSQCRRKCCANCINTDYVSPREKNKGKKLNRCIDCTVVEATSHSVSVQEELEAKDEINRGLKNELKQQLFAMEKFRGFMLDFCETFGPHSPIFQDEQASTVEGIDSMVPITQLVDHCQESLCNTKTKLKMVREERERALESEREMRKKIFTMQQEMEAISLERNELQKSMKKMNMEMIRMETEIDQLGNLKRECENLRQRCKKMEGAREEESGRFTTSSIWDSTEIMDTQNRRSLFLSICCPRIGR